MISRGLLFSRKTQKSRGLLTYQDQQTGASNFVNIDFTELCHIFLSTWHSMEYLIQNAENLRFRSPLLPDQSIWHLCLPTKNPSSKCPETVDAPEFSQAHLYRLVIMAATPMCLRLHPWTVHPRGNLPRHTIRNTSSETATTGMEFCF